MNQVYQIITEKILEQLKNNVVPWKRPWIGGIPMNLVSKREYRGINIFLLMLRDFANPFWLTYRQAESLGGHVKKAEKSTIVIFWKKLQKENDKGEIEEIPMLRYYRVFNVLHPVRGH